MVNNSVVNNTTLPHPKDGLRVIEREDDNRIYLDVQFYSGGEPQWEAPHIVSNLPNDLASYGQRDRQKIVFDALCRWYTSGGSAGELHEVMDRWSRTGLGLAPSGWQLWAIESECSFSYVFGDGAGHFFRWLEDEFVEPISQTDLTEGTGLEQASEEIQAES